MPKMKGKKTGGRKMKTGAKMPAMKTSRRKGAGGKMKKGY